MPADDLPPLPVLAEVPDGITWDGAHQPPVVAFLRARMDEQDPSPALAALRDVVEWAAGLEEERQWRDPRVPQQPVGLELLGVIAAVWSWHPDYRPEWDVGG